MTTTIKPLAGNADIDYNFADVCGPTTYEEMDSLFSKYCKEAGGKNHNDHVSKNIIKLNNAPNGLTRKTTIIKSKTQARVPSIDIENSINKGPAVPSRNSLLHLQRHDSQMKSERADFSKHATMRLDPRGGSISFNQPENPDHLQMAKDFNVPLQVYMGSSSPREREQRIIEYIKKTVSDEIKEFTKKHPGGKANKKLEKDLQKLKVKAETDKDDVFKWLHIRTFFEPLKKKLRARIIEGIRDDANQPIIDKMLEEINKSKDQSTTITSADNKITLENVAVVNNFDLLGNILEEGPSKHFRMSKSVKNLQKKTQQLSLITNSNSKPMSPSNNSPRQISMTSRTHLQTDTTDSKTPASDPYTWTERKERTFMSHRTDAKSRLFDKVTSSNWNDLGFSPMIQAYITDEKSKSERDVLLQRYLNGDLLSAEEYRFIASTSVSLNSCVDKKFLQKVVNYINPETINALELEIAESILKEYQKVRKEIKNARQDHLKEENQSLINRVQQGDQKMKKNTELQVKRYEQTKIKTRIVKYLDKVEEKKHWKKFKNQEPKLDSSYSSGPPITRQASHHVQIREEDGDEEEASAKQKKKEPETDPSTVRAFTFLKAFVRSPTYNKNNDIKLIKHFYHPSSKLISPSDPHQKDFLGVPTSFNDQKMKTVTHEDPLDYKLHIHSAAVLKDKPNFRKFYSGGPAENDENIFQGNYQFGDISHYKVTEAQRQVVPKIQAAWRGHKQRKAFIRILEIAKQKGKYYLDEYQNRYVRQESDLKSPIHKQNTKDFVLMKSNTKVLTDNSMLKNIQISTEEDNTLTRKQSSMLLDIDKKSSSVRHDDQYRSFSQFSQYEPSTQKNHRILSAKPKYFVSDAKKSNRPFTSTGRKPTESTRRETDNSYAHIREEEYYGGSASLTTRRKSPKRKIFDTSRDVITEAESSVHTRENGISQRAPPKGLLLKQRKLFIAAKANNLQMILASGFNYFSSDINAKDDSNNTPLFYAAKNGNKEICEFLLKHGALVNTPCSEGNTPLHAAFSSGQCMVVILLISKGGNLNLLNNYRQTPVAFGSESVLTLLGLTSAVATYEKHDGNKTLPVTLDNNSYLQRPDQNSIVKKDAILFKFQTLKKAQANVSDENHQLHTFVPIQERNHKIAL